MAVAPSLFIASVTALLLQTCGAKIAPSFIHPCKTTNWECLTKATREALPGFVKGIPELDIPPLDPFNIDEISMTLPGNLSFVFYNARATGLRHCKVNNVTAEVGNYQLLDFNCNLTTRGKYKAQGRVLLFPINGNGDAKIKIVNMHMLMRHKTKLTTDENGVHHVVSDGFTYKIEYEGSVQFQLTNLFQGNPELSQTVVSFLNENWRVVVGEFGKPIVDYFVNLADKTINRFFLAVPYEELIGVPFGSRN